MSVSQNPNQQSSSNTVENIASQTENSTTQQRHTTTSEDSSFESSEEAFVKNNYKSNDVATNTGATEDTLDAAFSSALGVTKANNSSGSNRADFYEEDFQGKSDAQEELEELNNADDEKHVDKI